MELWNAYNKHLKKLPFFLIRGKRIPKGVYHIVSEMIVRHVDGSFLAMRRSHEKSRYPDCWEISAGGAVKRGETPYQGAVRELKEETGIASSDLTPIYRFVYPRCRCIYMGYFCTVDVDKDKIILQNGETSDYVWVPEHEVLGFIDRADYVNVQAERIRKVLKEITE